MRSKLIAVALGATLVTALLGASGASAATEFGDSCIADRGTGEGVQATVFGISSTSSPSVAAPAAGVVTSWRLNLITPPPPTNPIPPIIPQTLKVLRVNQAAKIAQVIGESSGVVGSGTNTIPARIPVQPGDRLGLFGQGQITFEGETSEVGTLYCEESAAAGDIVGASPSSAPVGSSISYEETNEIRVPAVAVIEADADGDGFGDETQDKCPQSAAAQVACPVVKLSVSTQVKKKSVTVIITGPVAANVTVNGKVQLGKGKKAKIKGGTKGVAPGTFTRFKLRFPANLTNRLKELPPSKKLTLKITSSAPNVAAPPTKKVVKVKLKGQGPKT